MINLPRLVKGGKTILCIGSMTAEGEYPLGRGHVYCARYENMDNLPDEVDILVFMSEPIGEIRQQLVSLVKEGGDIHDAWKED